MLDCSTHSNQPPATVPAVEALTISSSVELAAGGSLLVVLVVGSFWFSRFRIMVKIISGVGKWAEAVGVKGSCHVEDSENIA